MVLGSNPSTVNWMVIFPHIFGKKIIMFVSKDENKTKKRLKMLNMYLVKHL